MYATWEEVFSLKDDKNNPLYNEDDINNLLECFSEYQRMLREKLCYIVDEISYLEFKEKLEKKILSYGISEIPTLSRQEIEFFENFHEKDFYSLKDKYMNNKWEFYIQCKKTQMFHNHGFELRVGKRSVTVLFQTNRYELIMERYLRAIYLLERYQCRFEKILNNLHIKNLNNFEVEKEQLNFIFAENYEISYHEKENPSDQESAVACYVDESKSIVLFFNAIYKPTTRDTIPAIEHELGHFLNVEFIKEELKIKGNEFLYLLRKDWKLAFINQKLISKGSKGRKFWYNHMSPLRDFKVRNRYCLLTHSKSNELFAESFSQALILKLAKKKVCRKGEETWLINMFPHTKYLIDKLLDGKRANRFKRLKPLRKGLKNV